HQEAARTEARHRTHPDRDPRARPGLREDRIARRRTNGPSGEHTHRPQESEEGLTMADTTNTAVPEVQVSRRNEKVGMVVSTKMQKTIVVEIEMRKAHPKYKRVMKSNK